MWLILVRYFDKFFLLLPQFFEVVECIIQRGHFLVNITRVADLLLGASVDVAEVGTRRLDNVHGATLMAQVDRCHT